MKKFEVTITETLSKKIIVEDMTAVEAENIADNMNFSDDIDWSSDVETDGYTEVIELKSKEKL